MVNCGTKNTTTQEWISHTCITSNRNRNAKIEFSSYSVIEVHYSLIVLRLSIIYIYILMFIISPHWIFIYWLFYFYTVTVKCSWVICNSYNSLGDIFWTWSTNRYIHNTLCTIIYSIYIYLSIYLLVSLSPLSVLRKICCSDFSILAGVSRKQSPLHWCQQCTKWSITAGPIYLRLYLTCPITWLPNACGSMLGYVVDVYQ